MRRPTLIRPVTLPETGAWPLVPPLSPSVAYVVETPDDLDRIYDSGAGFTYAREGHPDAATLALEVARLEGAEAGLVLGSGMAAVSLVMLGLLSRGDHVIGGAGLYGRSLRMLTEELPRFGIETTLVDTTDATSVQDALRPNTRLVLIETVSNPALEIADLEGIVAAIEGHPALLAVDNTFATPLGCRPLEHGADLVIHSLTKLMGGHSDVTLGWVGGAQAVLDRLEPLAVTLGLTASPWECWQASKALTSFAVRQAQAERNAHVLADHLAMLEGVKQVRYPGRADHPQAARARQLLTGGGNMVYFEVAGGRAAANRLTRAAAEAGIAFAPTLGDAGTTISHPASSSHRAMSEEARAALGMAEGSFRVSVGLEPSAEICNAFTSAVAALRN